MAIGLSTANTVTEPKADEPAVCAWRGELHSSSALLAAKDVDASRPREQLCPGQVALALGWRCEAGTRALSSGKQPPDGYSRSFPAVAPSMNALRSIFLTSGRSTSAGARSVMNRVSFPPPWSSPLPSSSSRPR